MSSTRPANPLHLLIRQTYEEVVVHYRHLRLDPDPYEFHLFSILERRCSLEDRLATASFLHKLHTKDLYLAVACCQADNLAWQHFESLYQEHIQKIARSVCGNPVRARDLSEEMLGYLFLPDAEGKPHIGTYEGIGSLRMWISSVLYHRAVIERKRKDNRGDRLDDLPEIADGRALDAVEARLRTSRYAQIIQQTFAQAVKSLSPRERLVLVLHCREGCHGNEIAALLGVTPPTLSYHLKRARQRLATEVRRLSESEYHLQTEAVEECLQERLENPEYSLLTLLGET